MIQGDLWGESIDKPASNLLNLEDPTGTERPLEPDEIILGPDGNPISSRQAWEIALQEGDGKGNVVGLDGNPVRRPKVLRMAGDQDFEILSREIDAGLTENTRRYLEFIAKIYRYSPFNMELIFMQAPYANFVQGYTAWTRGGYRIKTKDQGGKPIFILQPQPFMKITHKNEDGEVVEVQTPSVYFKIALTYDETSIDETVKKPPNFFTPLNGDATLLIARLVEILAEDGIRVLWDYPDIAVQGVSRIGIIKVRPDLPSVNTFLTLAHEAGHEWLHTLTDRKELPQMVKECQAEVFAYCIASHFGIQSPLSADYMRIYGNNKETLKANLKFTQPMIQKVIERMEAEYNLFAEFKYDPEAEGTRKKYEPPKRKHISRRKKS